MYIWQQDEFQAQGRRLANTLNGKYRGTFTLFGHEVPYIVIQRGYTTPFYTLKNLRTGKLEDVNVPTLESSRYRYGVYCLKCERSVYSRFKNDIQFCKCGLLNVDGGHDMLRIAGHEDYKLVKIDLLKRKVVEDV